MCNDISSVDPRTRYLNRRKSRDQQFRGISVGRSGDNKSLTGQPAAGSFAIKMLSTCTRFLESCSARSTSNINMRFYERDRSIVILLQAVSLAELDLFLLAF